MRVLSSLTPALSPRSGRTVRRVRGNASSGIGKILSPGERTEVRAAVQPFVCT